MARSSPAFQGLSVVLLVSLLVVASHVGATSNITCPQVMKWLIPCISYGVMGGAVPSDCCQGIRTLTNASKTAEDRQTQCNCAKEAAAKIHGLDYNRVNTISGICGTTSPYKLTHDLDCSSL